MDFTDIAETLDTSNDYRVLRRLKTPVRVSGNEGKPTSRAIVVDVETTGLDPNSDLIIEFAAIPITYDGNTGEICAVEKSFVFLEDPLRPIPAEITKITGITDAMVAGKRIDDDAISRLVSGTNLVIAHNASFDRKFVQQRMPFFKGSSWACSIKDLPWRERGHSSSALDYLLTKHCRMFFDGHRAEDDCYAVVQLLATRFESGENPLMLLLESTARRTLRVWAVGAPYEKKDLLKGRGYRWNGGEDGRPRSWYAELPAETRVAELLWLTQNVYGGRDGPVRCDALDATTRYLD